MRHRPVGSIITVGCHAVIDDGMIPFTAYISAETLNAFQWAGQPLKLPLPMGDLDPIEYMVCWVNASSQPQTASPLVQPFLLGSSV